MLSKPSTTTVVPERLLPVLHYVQGIPQSAWYKAACFLLSVLLVVSLVQWVWLLVPESEGRAVPAIAQSTSVKSTVKIDIAKLQSYNLFGSISGDAVDEQPAAPIMQKTVNAEPTRLKLALHGVVLASNPDEALAVIQYQGKEEQYSIGDKLPVGRVVLSQIHSDHVIIENAGRYESLWLFDSETNSSVASASKARPTSRSQPKKQDLREDKQVSSMARNYRQRLYKNPSSLADVIRISPQQNGGELLGYRVSPGRDRQQFEQLGLKPNDVVTSINGIALDDPAKAVEVYKIIRSASEATFVIDRKGEIVELVVSLDEG